jgi:CIC family chloride channel protein
MRRIAFGVPLRWGRPGRGRSQEPLGSRRAFARYTRAYFQRWLLIGALIGVVSGLGAIAFYWSIAFTTHWLLGTLAGYSPPQPASEGVTVVPPIAQGWSFHAILRRWPIPLVTTLGGLVCGLIVFTLAPEAEGHGTDAAIEAFHEKGGKIRTRVPLIKMFASAITIGSGGSAGREGPTAQISAGFGSWLGGVLRLDEHERRIAMAAGIGSGIGAIFKAPFGGALLAAEILYKRDFEADALFPSFVASVIGFSIFGAWAGWTPVFGAGGHFSFSHPASLGGYFVLGVCAGLVGLLYPKALYGIRDLFHHLRLPNHVKPAIGGLLVGLIGLVFPQALGMGYGFAQFAIDGDYLKLAAWVMAALVFVKILTTALTIGSGGSGGVFGPGMVIGGFLGGALWAGLHTAAPGLVTGTDAGAFAVVGMGAFFGGIAKAPLAVILLVAEMTGEYSLIVPAMLATMVAYLVTGDTSIYEQQVPTRVDSPAHRDDFALPLLRNLTVRDVMTPASEAGLALAAPDTPLLAIDRLLRDRPVLGVPIVEHGRLVGMVTPRDVVRVAPELLTTTLARQVMNRPVVRAYPDQSLYSAWLRMSRRGLRQLVVVARDDPSRVVGVLSAAGIGRLLRLPVDSATPAQELARGATPHGTAEPAAAPGPHRGAESRPPRDPLAQATVEAAMAPVADLLVRQAEPLAAARERILAAGALLVVDAHGNLVGIVAPFDIQGRPDGEDGRTLTVGEVAVRNVVTARPDETLRAVARRMSRLELRQLPVIATAMPTSPVGILRRSDILAAYGAATGSAGSQSSDDSAAGGRAAGTATVAARDTSE